MLFRRDLIPFEDLLELGPGRGQPAAIRFERRFEAGPEVEEGQRPF